MAKTREMRFCRNDIYLCIIILLYCKYVTMSVYQKFPRNSIPCANFHQYTQTHISLIGELPPHFDYLALVFHI